MTEAATSDPRNVPDPQTERRIALCLGAHRSGTSLVSAAMQAIGAELSLPIHESSEENLKGFFEHPAVVALDDDLLRLAGSAWDDSRFEAADLDKIPADAMADLRAKARAIVDSQWRNAPLAAIKDPRMCRLLPFWLPVLRNDGYADDNIRCVIVTRDPVEIAISQRTRCRKNPDFYEFGQTLDEGIALWLSHMRQALRDCGDRKMLVLAYADLLAQPTERLARMADFLGTTPDAAAIARFEAEFMDESLWRSHADEAAVAEVEAAFPGLLEVERMLADLSGQVVDHTAIAPILQRLDDPVFEATAREIVSRAYGRLATRRRVERLAALGTEHALDVAREARDAFARTRDEMARTTAEVEQRLRERITGLEAGVADRDTRLEQHKRAMAEARKVEGNLRDRITALEAGVSDRDARLEALRGEQARAIRQLGAAFEANQQQLVATQKALQQSQLDNTTLAASVTGLQADRDSLRDMLTAAETGRADFASQADELRSFVADLQQMNDDMRQSHSWRVTRPLRMGGTLARQTGKVPRAGLRALNHASRTGYHRMKRTHPETAALLHRTLKPLLIRANMRLLGQHNVPALPAPQVANPPGLAPGSFAFDYQQPRVYPPFQPLVTVIVPNYNHAPYLAKRLESIFAQTYENFEVLLLDDCSSDDSRAVLEEFAARHPDRARTLFNETNSGGVFHQWEKGLAAARGELIWIAESDDWASPNFLEALVPFFQNEVVQLAYARTLFMDASGENQIWSMEEYLAAYGPERWGRGWVETAPNIVRDVFSMTNIIPNVSSALFRRFERLDVLEIDQWRGMRTCGDWMFYLNAIRGGMLAYSPDAQNFYRIHDKNTSVTSHKADQFYREHEDVARCVRRHYHVPAGNLDRMEANLRDHWRMNRDTYTDEAFTACFDRARIEAGPTRKPALLMASFGFCAGGGETFPIQLANEVKAIGYEVTFLDCAQEPRVPGVRAKLATDIPVISNFPDLRRIVKNFDIDVIHSHHGWVDNTVLDLLPEGSDVRTVVTLHGFYETVPAQQLKLLLPRMLHRTAAMVYIADKNLVPMQDTNTPAKASFHRIDNAVGVSRLAPFDVGTLGIAEDAFVIVLVSRALPEKGWAEAIAATTLAREISGRDIQLIMVGDGEAKDLAEAAGVPAHVHLVGFRPNPQDYFAAADLGLLPSRFKGESFPLVVIESLIAGTPVLASDIGEVRSMLTTADGMAGELFALNQDWQIDTDDLARIIADLASNPDAVARLRARVPSAAERFDPAQMAEKYGEVYSAVSGGEAA